MEFAEYQHTETERTEVPNPSWPNLGILPWSPWTVKSLLLRGDTIPNSRWLRRLQLLSWRHFASEWFLDCFHVSSGYKKVFLSVCKQFFQPPFQFLQDPRRFRHFRDFAATCQNTPNSNIHAKITYTVKRGEIDKWHRESSEIPDVPQIHSYVGTAVTVQTPFTDTSKSEFRLLLRDPRAFRDIYLIISRQKNNRLKCL